MSQHGRSTQPSPGHCCCRRPGLLLLALFSPSPIPLLNKPRAPRRALGGAWAVAARSPAGFARIQPSTDNQHGPFWLPNLITKPLKMEQNSSGNGAISPTNSPRSPHPAPLSLPRAASSPQLRLKAVGDSRNPAARRGRDIIRAARLSALLLLPCKFTPRSLALHRSKSAAAETRGAAAFPRAPHIQPICLGVPGLWGHFSLQKPFLGLCFPPLEAISS